MQLLKKTFNFEENFPLHVKKTFTINLSRLFLARQGIRW
jgi:hypothetical protein